MKLLVVRSIPLSQETQDAWHSINAKFLKRERNGIVPNSIADQYDAIINYGNWEQSFQYKGDKTVLNTPTSNKAVCYPSALRETLGTFLPPPELKAPHWHKKSGHKGAGKVFHETLLGECAVTSGDVQLHLYGSEYRVITVGDKVVQATKKVPKSEGWPPIPTSFEFEWVGVQGIAQNGIIPMLKAAIPDIPNWQFTIFGWDIIVDVEHGPHIIECNTSPGINEPTAQRIQKEIEVLLNAQSNFD